MAAAARKRRRTSEGPAAVDAPVLSAVAARRALLARQQSTPEPEAPFIDPASQDPAEEDPFVLSSSGPSSEQEDEDAYIRVARELGVGDLPEPGAFGHRNRGSSKRYYAQDGPAQLSVTVDEVVSEEGARSEDVDVLHKQRKKFNKRDKTSVSLSHSALLARVFSFLFFSSG
jgi:hypothetical protein